MSVERRIELTGALGLLPLRINHSRSFSVPVFFFGGIFMEEIKVDYSNGEDYTVYWGVHNTNSEDCWCEPEIIIYENGNKVIIHNGEN